EGALGALARRRERLSQLDDGDRPRAVVIRAVTDRVGAAGRAPLTRGRRADMVHVRGEEHVFLFQRGVVALQDAYHVGGGRALEQLLVHGELHPDSGAGMGGGRPLAPAAERGGWW